LKESQIEKRLRDKVKALGGKAYKFVSPGNNGVPDRLLCLPKGRAFFVETKRPGEKPTVQQRNKHREFRALGFLVFGCIDSIEDVDKVIEVLMGRKPTEQEFQELEMVDVE
jgi:hypothetical protein